MRGNLGGKCAWLGEALDERSGEILGESLIESLGEKLD